jgi:hypothetical protein
MKSKSNLTSKQKADLYVDFYKLYKTGSPNSSGLTELELSKKWDLLMEDFLEDQKTFPGRERLRRLGFLIEEPKDERKPANRKLAKI